VDGITAGTALAGTADPGATVHVTVDGGAVAAAVRADDGGAWSYLPPGLTDGRHTVQVGEADASGHAGTASLSFVLDTRAPAAAFTGGTQVGDNVTLSGHAGEGGARIALFDGDLSLGTVVAGSDGRWSFGAAAASAVTHDYRATAVDVAGNEAATGSRLILGSVGNDDLAGGAGNDTIAAAGGDDRIAGGAGADRLTGGSGNDTFVFAVVADSPRGAPDVIADFRHDADKIDFTGLTAALHFQGDISGLGNLTLGARSIAFLEVAGSTQVLVNVTDNAAIVTAADFHAADLEIVLTGVHLGLAASDFLVG
jgi:Ca2+-binding RTX toxin-like protein